MDEPTWLSDTLHCPMIPPTLLQFEQSEAVAAAGLAQGTLVEELLPWTGSEFLSDLLRLRSEIDETLHAADDGLNLRCSRVRDRLHVAVDDRRQLCAKAS